MVEEIPYSLSRWWSHILWSYVIIRKFSDLEDKNLPVIYREFDIKWISETFFQSFSYRHQSLVYFLIKNSNPFIIYILELTHHTMINPSFR